MTPERQAPPRRPRRPGAGRAAGDRIFGREADHRIRNSLQLVSSMLSIQARDIGDPVLAAHLADAAARISAIARLHDHLSSGGAETVELTAYLRAVCDDVRAASGCDLRGVDIQVQGDPVLLGGDQAVLIGLIVNELATNAIKYAYPRGGGVVRVRIDGSASAGRYAVTVEDDGPGLSDAAVSAGRVHGLDIIKRLARRLGGQLRLDAPARERGVTAQITVPAGPPAA